MESPNWTCSAKTRPTGVRCRAEVAEQGGPHLFSLLPWRAGPVFFVMLCWAALGPLCHSCCLVALLRCCLVARHWIQKSASETEMRDRQGRQRPQIALYRNVQRCSTVRLVLPRVTAAKPSAASRHICHHTMRDDTVLSCSQQRGCKQASQADAGQYARNSRPDTHPPRCCFLIHSHTRERERERCQVKLPLWPGRNVDS